MVTYRIVNGKIQRTTTGNGGKYCDIAGCPNGYLGYVSTIKKWLKLAATGDAHYLCENHARKAGFIW